MLVQRPPRGQFGCLQWSLGSSTTQCGKLVNRFLRRKESYCSQGVEKQAARLFTAAAKAEETAAAAAAAAAVVRYSADKTKAYLKQGLGVKALQQACKVLERDPGHVQSFVCKCKAFLLLQHYEAAVECLEEVFKLPGITEASNQEARQLLAEAVRLRNESLHGSHDFAGALLLERQESVFADFVGPVTVALTNDGKGRGLFATRDVCKGELLLVANSTVYCKDKHPETGLSDPDMLLQEAVRSCLASSKAYRQLLNALDSSKVPSMDDYSPNVVWWLDVDSTPLDVVKISKAMQGYGDSDIAAAGHGVWSLPALMNHSCLPNVLTKIVNRAMFVRACRDISCGEELLRKYVSVDLPFHAGRTATLKFQCSCERCKLESRMEQHLEDLGREYSRCKSMTSSSASLLGYLEVAINLEARMKAFDLSVQEKDWLRASYNEAYYGASLVPEDRRAGMLPDNAEVLATLVKVVPGDTFDTMLNFGRRSRGAIVVPTENLQGRELLEMLILANCGQLPAEVMDGMVRFLAPGWMTRLNPSYLSSLIVRNAHR